MRICTACGTENPEQARFCLGCGSPLADAAPAVPPSEERKVITAIFVDLVGSTARSEQLDPEDIKSLVAPYHARVRAELERHGGTFEKFSGDAVLALFGSPKAHEDDPERAVRAALGVRSAIAELNAEDEWLDLHIRIGIHTGEALVMLGARPSEGEWSAAGDVLNTAARIQSAAPVNGILVGELTYAATRDAFDYRDAEPVAAKGKAEPVRVWEAVDVKEDAHAPAADAVTFVGREREAKTLTDAWSTAIAERRPGLVTIVGPPGIGKSRLLAEFAQRAGQDGRVHWGRCLSYGEGITYWPVTEVVRSAAGILQGDGREAIAGKLESFLGTLATDDLDELRTIAAGLSNLTGIPTTPRGTYAAGEISQGELHWGIRRMLQLLASEQPTALILEDLHWAEPTLLELIAYIVAGDAEAPLAIVCSTRPELAETAPGFINADGRRQTLELGTLDYATAAALLADLLGDPSLAETPFAETLIANAGGNPLFLEETVRMLRDRGLVDIERWRSADVGELPVPTSVQGLISSRLDRLDGGDKLLAHNAAVVGAVFWAGAVAHLGGHDGSPAADPRTGLDTLEQRDFVLHSDVSTIAGEDEYAFKHILMRDVAYGQIPKGRRAELHVRFSDWIEGLPESADEFVELVAWHLEQACRLSREVARMPIEPPFLEAAQALATAARRAERREGLHEADRYYTRALDVLGDAHPDLQLELRLRRADIMMMIGKLKEACDELEQIAEAAPGFERPDVECEASLLLGDIDQRQGRAAEAHRRLAAAQALAESIGDAYLRTKVAFVLAALVADFEGAYDQAIGNLRSGIDAAEEINDVALVAEGHLRLAAILNNRGDLAAAETELRSCLELARELGSHRVEAEATSWLGEITYHRGNPEEGERLCRQARTWFERTGDSYFQAQNLVRNLGGFALADGRPQEAETLLQEAIPIAVQIGGWVAIEAYRYLVEALVAQDRIEDARELVAFAARDLPEEDAYARSALSLAEAIVATAASEEATAATAFAEAVRLTEELGMPRELGEVRMALGRSLRQFGDLTGARAELERARAIFIRIGAETRRDAIDRELLELVEGPTPAGPSNL
jgi:class 3 adenylate cyclase/tetratricopeptide (TPR) repeat protein